jgi:glycosyltransferase involved in cell wall biosynthesis
LPEGVRVVGYDDSGGRPGNAFRLAIKVLRVAIKDVPAVVHVHSTFAGVTVRLAMLLMLWRCPRVIYCAHGWLFDRPMSSMALLGAKMVERWLSMVTHVVVCISAHDFSLALKAGIKSNKLRVVLNGVASDGPTPIDVSPDWMDGRLRVLFVGRFDRQKGIDILFDALKLLENDVHAFVAGGAVLGDEGLPEGPPQCANFLGWVSPDVLEVYRRSADVMIIPSRWEGFGLVAVEAMRAGLAVIASRTGGLKEIVEDGVTGVLFEPGSVSELVEAISSRDSLEWRKMGLAARARFEERFTMERVHSDIRDAYGL